MIIGIRARVQIQNCKLKQDVWVEAVRRNARPPRLPKVASGVTTLSMRKDFKRETLTESGVEIIKLSTTIDTTSGGFSAIPHYFTRLRTTNGLLLSLFMFGTVIQVSSEAPTSFVLEIFNSLQFVAAKARRVDLESASTFDIVWIGVEE